MNITPRPKNPDAEWYYLPCPDDTASLLEKAEWMISVLGFKDRTHRHYAILMLDAIYKNWPAYVEGYDFPIDDGLVEQFIEAWIFATKNHAAGALRGQEWIHDGEPPQADWSWINALDVRPNKPGEPA